MSMTLHFALDPELTPELRAEIVTLWTDATNAGGAVGFVPPATEDRSGRRRASSSPASARRATRAPTGC